MAKKLKPGLLAIGLKGEINANYREAMKAGNELVRYTLDMGRLLIKAKADVPHGEWESWVDQYCDFNIRTASRSMKLHVEFSHLLSEKNQKKIMSEVVSVAELKKLLPSAVVPKSDTVTSSAQEEGVEETDDSTPPIDPAEPYGKGEECPVCQSDAWQDDDAGTFCSSCRHPYGEPAADDDAGEEPELPVTDQTPEEPGYEPDAIDDAKAQLEARLKAIHLWTAGSHTKERDILSFDDIAKLCGAGQRDKRKQMLKHLDQAQAVLKLWIAQIH